MSITGGRDDDFPRFVFPKIDFPKIDPSVFDIPKVDFSMFELPRIDLSVFDIPKIDVSVFVPPRIDLSMFAFPKIDPSVFNIPTVDFSMFELPRIDVAGFLKALSDEAALSVEATREGVRVVVRDALHTADDAEDAQYDWSWERLESCTPALLLLFAFLQLVITFLTEKDAIVENMAELVTLTGDAVWKLLTYMAALLYFGYHPPS